MKTQMISWILMLGAFALGVIVTASLPGCQPKKPIASSSTTTPGPALDDEDDLLTPEAAETDIIPAALTERLAESEQAAESEPVAKSEPAPESEPATDPAPAAESKPAPKNEPAAETEPASQPTEPDTASAEVETVATHDVLAAVDKNANAPIIEGDWTQWGGTSYRNNVPITGPLPTFFDVGRKNRRTGEWETQPKNIKWTAALGSQTYGNPVVADGKVYVGTNNGAGYLPRYPADIDLGCLLCFNEEDGTFLWQHSSEKLDTGRVHDWPLQGICCSPYIEGDRLWFVTSRGEVRCLDTMGFYNDVDNGPVQNEPARLFNVESASDDYEPAIAGLEEGTVTEAVRAEFARVEMPLPEEVKLEAVEAGKKWLLTAEINGHQREIRLTVAGPRLTVFKTITVADKHEADTIWVLDMMKDLGVSQHNMCSCSVTALGDILFVCTSNGVDESHIVLPSPNAPSFIALDKNTGEVLWTDKSPGVNILHGQWSSPAVAELGGVPQVIFAGGDSWLYSFRADRGKDGSPELLWKFDANPKETKYILGGRGTRNEIIGTPVVYDGLVYIAVGQDPEHGEGDGHLWCIDPTKRGDISPQLAMKIEKDKRVPIPPRRLQAVIPEEGEVAVDNPNSAVVWHYSAYDQNGDGEIDFEEQLHRSIGTVAIQDDLLFIADFSGLFHCVDAKGDGQGNPTVYWTYDMLAASWGSPLIADGKVFIGDEDGDLAIFNLSGDPNEAMKIYTDKRGREKLVPINADEDGNVPNMGSSVYSTPVVANGVIYLSTKDQLIAIAPEAAEVAVAEDTAAEEPAAEESVSEEQVSE